MVCVDATNAAKVMLRLARIPLVKRQLVLALCDSQPINDDTSHDCALAPAKRAVAAAQLLETVVQIDFELNRAAMATTALGFHDDLPVRSNNT